MHQNSAHLFLRNVVIYEVNIRQYTVEGTFKAFLQHLPRLKNMGINILWLMPIQPIGFVNRKGNLGSYYSIKDYTAINPEFGDEADFRTLLNNAHQLGLKVIIDWVANHTAWDHHWVTTHPAFYEYNENGGLKIPYDWDDVVQLNHTNKEQQKAMVQSMQYWVEQFDIDGFRCDMAHLTPLETWRLAKETCEKQKPLIWLAETQDTSYFEVFDIIYGWEWLHGMEEVYKGLKNAQDLNAIVQYYLQTYNQGKYRILFTSNHDENSWQGTEYDRLGNSTKTFAVLCALLPGIPLVYSGQEEPLQKRLHFFEKDCIEWGSYRLNEFYKSVFDFSDFQEATYFHLNTSHNEKLLAYLIQTDQKEILIIANLTNEAQMFRLYDERIKGVFKEYWNENKLVENFNEPFLIKDWETKLYFK